MKRLAIWMNIIIILTMLCFGDAIAEIISTRQLVISEAHFLFRPNEKPPVITDFGPGNIHLLKGVDFVVDREGRLAGIIIRYITPDQKYWETFVADVVGWYFKRYPRGTVFQKIMIRFITVDSLHLTDIQ